MSDVINIVLQTGVSDEALVEQINTITKQANVGELVRVDGTLCGGSKALEVEVYFMTLNGYVAIAQQIEELVQAYREDIPEDGQVVLLITREDQATKVIRPGSADRSR